jgi:hypothetical protein
MRLRETDVTKPRRLSFKKATAPEAVIDSPKEETVITPQKPIYSTPSPAVTIQAPPERVAPAREYHTEEEQLLSYFAAKNANITKAVNFLQGQSLQTGQRLRIDPLIILSVNLLEPEQHYSKQEVLTRLQRAGYQGQAAEDLLQAISLPDGCSYSFPEPPGRIWRLRTEDGLTYWAANSTPF